MQTTVRLRSADPTPTATIVISSYNQSEFLEEAIRSARQQSAPAMIVVVDDGSTDGSADLAEATGIRTVRLPHTGALQTFRAGVDLVRTPFYCLLNGDDALEPSFLERTLPHMQDPRVGFVYTGVRHVGSRKGVLNAHPFDSRALRWGNLAHGASLVRKAAYTSVGGFDPRFADHHEDWALWVAMVVQGWRGAAVDEPLLRYRQHAEARRNPRDLREFERARWRLARAHPGFYGPLGIARLVAWSLRRRMLPVAQPPAANERDSSIDAAR